MMNGDSSQASETTPVEVSKKSIRSDVWHNMQKNQLCSKPMYSYNRIPRFVGAEEAVTKLKELPEFKNANHILVNPDRAQDVVRMACLQEGKTLYVQPPRIKKYLMTKLNVQVDTSEEEMLKALTVKGLEKNGTQIGLEDKIPLDLVVVGSVAVTKEGNRIGRGQTFVDLCLGMLKEMGYITPETLIATTVHDSQVVENIPSTIMGTHDFPVDIIVTPTQVIRTQRVPQPEGLLWNLISKRKIKQVPLLGTLRDKEIESGKACTLKETESEAESENERGRWRPPRRFYGGSRRPGGRRPQQNNYHQNGGAPTTQSESEQVEGTDGEKAPVRKQTTYYRRFYHYRRNTNNDDGTTKQSFRNKAWQLLQKNHVVTTPRHPYYRIPGYKGAEETAKVLRERDCYKQANSVLVNGDKTHEAIRLACLEDGKKLYVLLPKIAKEFVVRIDVPENFLNGEQSEGETKTEEEGNNKEEGKKKPDLKSIITRHGIEQYGTKLDMSEPFTVDLVVFCSLAVSKEGYRIGKGNGHADITYAILRHMNAITPETPVITTVHDYQVFETFPSDMFLEHDVPVDAIVTGTQYIPIDPLKPKPSGVKWNLLKERHLKYMPMISELRDKEIEAGNTCDLKEEDPNESIRRRRNYRSYNYSESEHNETAEAESGDHSRRSHGTRRYNRHRRSTNEKGDVENGAESGGNMSPDTTTNRKRRQNRQSQPQIEFTIKLSNIKKNIRIRDLRSALQERSVKPALITWMGFKGFCYLHFAKLSSATSNGDVQQTGPDSILESLANLTLHSSDSVTDQPTTDQTISEKLVVQLAKPLATRIETAEQTAV